MKEDRDTKEMLRDIHAMPQSVADAWQQFTRIVVPNMKPEHIDSLGNLRAAYYSGATFMFSYLLQVTQDRSLTNEDVQDVFDFLGDELDAHIKQTILSWRQPKGAA